MNIETARSFLLSCTLINYGILLVWGLVFITAGDWHYRLTRRFFRVSKEQYDLISFGGIAVYKIAVIVLNLVPCPSSAVMTKVQHS